MLARFLKSAVVVSFALPAASRLFPRCLPDGSRLDAPHLGPASPSLAGKHIADSCRLSTRTMGHLAWDAGTDIGAGDGEPLGFCQECRRRAFAHPRSVLFAACSRPRPRCDPCSFRPPLLHSSCTDDLASQVGTLLSSPCKGRECTRNRQGKVRGRPARNIWRELKHMYDYMNVTPGEHVVS